MAGAVAGAARGGGRRPRGGAAGFVAGALCAAVIAVAGVRLVRVAPVRAFDTDEFEHLHVAWSIARGEVPYRDFFEHHTPLFHLGLSVLCAHDRPETGPAAAVGCVLAARRFGAAATLALGLAAGALAWRLRGPLGGAVAVAVVLGSEVVVAKGLEVRPDAAAVALVVVAAMILAGGGPAGRSPSLLAAAAAGAMAGAAVMLTQKAAFLLPGLALGALPAPRSLRAHAWRPAALRLAALAAGAVAPAVAVGAWLAHHGALARAVELTLLESLGRGFVLPLSHAAWVVCAADPFLVVFGCAGGAVGLVQWWRGDGGRGAGLAAWPAVGAVAGLAVMPVPFLQSLLLALPFLAVCLAMLLCDALAAASAGRWPAVAGFAALAAVAWGLAVAGPPVAAPDWADPATGGALATPAGAIGWALAWLGVLGLGAAGSAPVAAALAAAILQPAAWGLSAGLLQHRNEEQIETIRWVAAATPPDAKVLDGWTGLGVFRPHAWYYFMVPPQVRAMLPDASLRQLAADLRSGEVAPDLVVVDEAVVSLGAEVAAALRGRCRRRLGPFLECAAVPPPGR